MIKITITGPKSVGKTTVARAIKGYLKETLGYSVELCDEPGDLSMSLVRNEILKLAESNTNFQLPNVEIFSNQEEAEVFSNRELTQRIRRLETRLR